MDLDAQKLERLKTALARDAAEFDEFAKARGDSLTTAAALSFVDHAVRVEVASVEPEFVIRLYLIESNLMEVHLPPVWADEVLMRCPGC